MEKKVNKHLLCVCMLLNVKYAFKVYVYCIARCGAFHHLNSNVKAFFYEKALL